jgi:hypothetical protein
MKVTILFTFLFLNLSAFAQELTCLDKLLPYNRFSGLHQISRDEWNDGKDGLDGENARLALNYLITNKLLCKTSEVVIKVHPVCTPIIGDLVQSNTCFIFTNLGYFIANRDSGRNVNFIFSKDKKFNEN